MTSSPIYSRGTRIHGDRRIYVSGLLASKVAGGEGQVKSIFGDLQQIRNAAGSDLQHLAKATCYVSDDDPSAALNRLRPDYYNPERPPAASKAKVRGVGYADRSIVIDMIAGPVSVP